MVNLDYGRQLLSDSGGCAVRRNADLLDEMKVDTVGPPNVKKKENDNLQSQVDIHTEQHISQRVVFVCVCVDGPELFASTNLPFKETDEKK